MTLSVRLPHSLDEKLQDFCDFEGVTKSQVVQAALSAYLASQAPRRKKVSSTYIALKRAGLIGCVRGSGESATKEVVRRRVLEALKRES